MAHRRGREVLVRIAHRVRVAEEAVADPGGDGTRELTDAVHKNLPYDAVRDFADISRIGYATVVLVVSPSLGVKSVRTDIETFRKMARFAGLIGR